MSELPSIKPGQVVAASEMDTIEVATTSTLGPPRIVTLSISAPAIELDSDGYSQRFVQLRLSVPQARRLKEIQLGLEERNAQLMDESYVNSPLDAVRWMLENAG